MPPKDRQREKRQRGESQDASQRSQSSKHQGSQSNKRQRTNSSSHGNKYHKPSKGAPSDKDEKYVVIIQNVENDFTKVHQYNLPAYCHLVPELNQANLNLQSPPGARGGHPQSGKNSTVGGEGKEASQNAGDKDGKDHNGDSVASGEGKCTYSILCRSETRSAELTVRGPADAPIHTVFTSSAAGSTKRPGKPAAGTLKSADSSQTPASLTEGLEITEETSSRREAGAARGAFSSLEEMVRGLCHRPYFTHPPHLHVNLPGHEPGEVLLAGKGKRRRGKEKTPEGEAPPSNDGDGATGIQQFPGHQRDLVSAVAVVSSGWNVKDLRRHLRDLPGFLSCWRLYARHFRVVFRDQETLFKAKQLLDQFHVEGNVHVEMKLSDTHSRSFVAFIAKEEEETAAMYG